MSEIPNYIAHQLKLVAAENSFSAGVLEEYIEELLAKAGMPGSAANSLRSGVRVDEAEATPVAGSVSPDTETSPDDIAELEKGWTECFECGMIMLKGDLLKRMISCIRECAMEAEIGHELGGFRVTLLQRYGLTDGSDPEFGPVKYESLRPPGEPKPF